MSIRHRLFQIKKQLQRQYTIMRTQPAGPPNFLVIGGVKCGTSSLYAYLRQHPQVVMSMGKEVGYFNSDDLNYPDHPKYEQQFRIMDDRSSDDIVAIGEATPSYCFSPAIERIYKYKPQMQLIMLVRNPIERAVSQYHMYVRKNMEERPIREAILADDAERPYHSYAYLTRGRYHEQLDLIRRYFPQRQLLVLRLEDLKADPTNFMEAVFKFLGIESIHHIAYKAYNTGQYKAIEPSFRAELQQYFEPYNQRLHQDYGIRIDDWV